MRIPKQGRAAVSGERGLRRRSHRLPGLWVLGRGRTSLGLSRISWSAVGFPLGILYVYGRSAGVPFLFVKPAQVRDM